ncbi:MAG: GntR family transcriptional regulator, partial [Victivallales bacterium]|nr:GntR family transcriptional regulator [Victivallales bacterium]
MPDAIRNGRRHALAAVIKSLREYIIDHRLRPGDRLPTEHELARQFGSSRNIIREGMRYFRALGIITSGPRVGATVGRLFPVDPFAGYLPFLSGDPRSVDEARQLRLALETGFAALMIEHCDAADLAALTALPEQFLANRECRDADIMFHSRLLRLTRNRLAESLIPLVVGLPASSGALHPWFGDDVELICGRHREIVAALSAGDRE